MADDVISMIKTDHKEVERLFSLMREDPSSPPLVLPLAVSMVIAHSRGEEDHVYPVLAREAGEKKEAQHSLDEHQQAEQLGKHLLSLDPTSGEFRSQLEEFMNAVLHHAEEEESELLPALAKAVDSARLQEMGMAFARRRAQELTGEHFGGNGSARRSSSRRTAGRTGGGRSASKTASSKTAGRAGGKRRASKSASSTTAGMSKQELLNEARKLDIPGRSSMSKEQLAREVAKAG